MIMINIKRTWKPCTNPEINKIYNEVFNATKELYPEYFDCKISFYLDTSTSHLGRCTTHLRRDSIYSKWGTVNHYGNLRYNEVVILLSKYVTDLDVVRRTLIHEFGHMVTPRENHSYSWEARTKRIGAKFNEHDFRRLASTDDSESFRQQIAASGAKKEAKTYTVVCSKCGRVVTRRKMCDVIKHPENWRCGVCNSPLQHS